ncbi:MAG: ABC transporter permease, partial [Pseudoxanthomonas sp.]
MSAAGVWLAEAAQSWRALLRRPGYLLLAALTLALGVATATTVFALIDQALLRPLPFPQAERLVTLGMQMDGEDGWTEQNSGAPALYGPLKRMQELTATGMAMGFTRNVNIGYAGTDQVVAGLHVDRGFLQTLGVSPVLGRNFDPDEDRPNGPQAVILSHDFWQRSFAGDPGVIGRTLQVEGKAVPIVGVLPREFVWPDHFDLLLSLQPDLNSDNIGNNQYIVGRMRDGVGLEALSAAAGASMRHTMIRLDDSAEGRAFIDRMHLGALPLESSVFSSRSGRTLWMFLAASLCVLAIAAVNLANLLLLRTLARDHDRAVRAALGAPWGRLLLPRFAEALLIGGLGSVLGVLLSGVGLRLLGQWVPAEWLRGQAPALGPGALAFAVLAGLAVALLGALLGAWRVRRYSAASGLGGGSMGLGRDAGRLARALIVVQVAAAALLLMIGALFARSLQKLSAVPMGFESRSMVTFVLAPVRDRNPGIAEAAGQTRGLLEALRRRPEVLRAGAASNLPTASQFRTTIALPNGSDTVQQFRPVTPGFLQAVGIPLLAGRGLDARYDDTRGEAACVVSASFAREFLGGDAVGKRISLPIDPEFFMRIVGVVGDVRQFGPSEPPPPVVYMPLAQLPDALWTRWRDFTPLNYVLQVRPGTEAALMQRLPELVRQVSPGQPITDIQTMQAVVASTTRDQKLNLLLIGVFSALALLLAAVGLYAVMAVAVAARRHEFGVRAALGAAPARLLRQVLGEGACQLALGLAIGLAIALALSRLLQRFLFGV